MHDEDDRPDAKVIPFTGPVRPASAAPPLPDAPEAKLLDIAAAASRRKPTPRDGDSVGFRVVRGEVAMMVTQRGRKRFFFFDDAAHAEKWAESLLQTVRGCRRKLKDEETMKLWTAALAAIVELPPAEAGGFYRFDLDNMKERLSKATALSVGRSFYRLGLETQSCRVLAEQLTGRKFAKASDPATRGDHFLGSGMRSDRLEGALLLNWWRQGLIDKGLSPMALKLRNPEADIALAKARQAQTDSGERHFIYHRRKTGWEVWLWQGIHGLNLTARKGAPHCPHRSDAIAWAKSYAASEGFPYAEAVRMVGLAKLPHGT